MAGTTGPRLRTGGSAGTQCKSRLPNKTCRLRNAIHRTGLRIQTTRALTINLTKELTNRISSSTQNLPGTGMTQTHIAPSPYTHRGHRHNNHQKQTIQRTRIRGTVLQIHLKTSPRTSPMHKARLSHGSRQITILLNPTIRTSTVKPKTGLITRSISTQNRRRTHSIHTHTLTTLRHIRHSNNVRTGQRHLIGMNTIRSTGIGTVHRTLRRLTGQTLQQIYNRTRHTNRIITKPRQSSTRPQTAHLPCLRRTIRSLVGRAITAGHRRHIGTNDHTHRLHNSTQANHRTRIGTVHHQPMNNGHTARRLNSLNTHTTLQNKINSSRHVSGIGHRTTSLPHQP